MLMKGTSGRKESSSLKNLGADLRNICATEVNRRISGCFKQKDSHEIQDPVSPIEDKNTLIKDDIPEPEKPVSAFTSELIGRERLNSAFKKYDSKDMKEPQDGEVLKEAKKEKTGDQTFGQHSQQPSNLVSKRGSGEADPNKEKKEIPPP